MKLAPIATDQPAKVKGGLSECTFTDENAPGYEWLGCGPGASCNLYEQKCEGSLTTASAWYAPVYCADLDYAGHSDWVLPSIDAYRTLFQGCDGGLSNTGESCSVAQECSYFENEHTFDYYDCGCSPDHSGSVVNCGHQSCAGCVAGEGPRDDGCYVAAAYLGFKGESTTACAQTNYFHSRTKYKSSSSGSVQYMGIKPSEWGNSHEPAD